MTKALEERVKEFRTRPLSEDYLFVWIDAIDEKVFSDGLVVAVAIMIGYGVTSSGQREVLAV